MYTCRLMCAQHVHAKATPMPLLVNMGPGHGLLSGLVPRAAARCWGALLGTGALSPAFPSQRYLGLELDSGGPGHVPADGGLMGMGT